MLTLFTDMIKLLWLPLIQKSRQMTTFAWPALLFSVQIHVRPEGILKQKSNLFTRYPLVMFFLLTYLLSWWSVPVMGGALFPYGPALAALIVLAIGQGRPGLREWWARLTQWRAGRWYLVGPALIAAALLAAFGLYRIFSGTVTPLPGLPVPAIWLELLLLGGLWEEPGFTGYALPKLQERFAPKKHGLLIATLVMAVLRAIWHIPLLASGTLPWFDVFGYIIAFQIIISWLYNRSGGSVPAVMLFHYASNLLAGGMMLRAFTGDDRLLYWALFAACAILIALVILLRDGTTLGARSRAANEAVTPALTGEQ